MSYSYTDGSPCRVGDLVRGPTAGSAKPQYGIVVYVKGDCGCLCRVVTKFNVVDQGPRVYPMVLSSGWEYAEPDKLTLVTRGFAESLAPIPAVE